MIRSGRMAGWTFLLPLCGLLTVSVASVPQLPHAYHVTGTIYLPKADVVEPFEAWFDPDKGKSRIDYYHGDAQIINRGDVGQYGAVYKIVFETTKEYMNMRTCFAINGTSDGKVMPQGMFPDMSDYQSTNTTTKYKGVECDVYYYEFQEGSKQNKYAMLINHATGMPAVFSFIGYDNLFGSHFDEYVFEYDTIETSFDESVFNIYQMMSCGPYPGPGLAHVMHANPVFELIGSPDYDRSVQSAEMDKQFEEFKKKHGKAYRDDNEHEQRKTNFRNNFRYIDSNNRKALTYSLAVNHMTDLSNDELKMMRGYRHTKGAKGGIEFTSDVSVDLIPETWDWRIRGAVSPIKDQGICGSCWSFGTTGTIEGAYFLKHKMMVTMSEQALMDCSWGYGNNGCDGGETFRAYEWIMDNGCIPTEDTYGQYLQQDGFCHNKEAVCGATLSNYTKIPSGNRDSLRVAIATEGPVAVAIDASHKSFSFYGSGVYYERECGNKEDDLDHSVLAIGYGTLHMEDYWLIKNSWSPFWGNQGYVLMSRRDNNCGVATDADFAIVK